ncbi:DNA recombinational repair protein BRCA2 [Ceraceosorus bombacis]|uniref:DNA recombinational repair protein BRCA2 n=1 Tax=Ceraceosorus bombacis TaxID=401625 RepID=A0A0P1BLK0_9BASI|nr:DNA recombinational repair protein BRCA2 [Ceraceosorus bombacis]
MSSPKRRRTSTRLSEQQAEPLAAIAIPSTSRISAGSDESSAKHTNGRAERDARARWSAHSCDAAPPTRALRRRDASCVKTPSARPQLLGTAKEKAREEQKRQKDLEAFDAMRQADQLIMATSADRRARRRASRSAAQDGDLPGKDMNEEDPIRAKASSDVVRIAEKSTRRADPRILAPSSSPLEDGAHVKPIGVARGSAGAFEENERMSKVPHRTLDSPRQREGRSSHAQHAEETGASQAGGDADDKGLPGCAGQDDACPLSLQEEGAASVWAHHERPLPASHPMPTSKSPTLACEREKAVRLDAKLEQTQSTAHDEDSQALDTVRASDAGSGVAVEDPNSALAATVLLERLSPTTTTRSAPIDSGSRDLWELQTHSSQWRDGPLAVYQPGPSHCNVDAADSLKPCSNSPTLVSQAPVEPIVAPSSSREPFSTAVSDPVPPAQGNGVFSSPGQQRGIVAMGNLTNMHSNLLDGLDSEDFDDVQLSPEGSAKRMCSPHPVVDSQTRSQLAPDASPAVVARAFKRARSARSTSASKPLQELQHAPASKAKQSFGDSDDEFSLDPDLFADLEGVDFDFDAQKFDGDTGEAASSKLKRDGGPKFGFTTSAVGGGFSTGRGKAFAMPSAAVLEAARARFLDMNDDDFKAGVAATTTTSLTARAKPAPPAAALATPSRSRMPLAQTTNENMPLQHAALTSTENEYVTPAKPKMGSRTTSTDGASPAPQAVGRTEHVAGSNLGFSLPRSGSTPRPKPQNWPASTSALPFPFNAPSSANRVALGITPRTSLGRNPAGRPKFQSPFKRPPGQALPASASKLATSSSRVGLSAASASASPSVKRSRPDGLFDIPIAYARPSGTVVGHEYAVSSKTKQPAKGEALFDLSTHSAKRQSMQQRGIKPESTSAKKIRQMFDEVPVILDQPARGIEFEFDMPDGSSFGPRQALDALHQRRAVHVDLEWVKNHWLLILWKMAAITRHEPDRHESMFTGKEMLNQLLYRYEREVNLAQRSAVKRIQEQDSASGRPMILCVWSIAKDLEADEAPFLELTDGWYRIRATIDEPMRRAVLRGLIKVGVKLSISGARRDGTPEPVEVLKGLNISSLILNSNGTALARWDARLGFVGKPFVATLRSLNARGGVVPRMEIIVTRLFPIGYIDSADRCGGDAGQAITMTNVRSEAEEEEQRQAWMQKLADARTRLEDEAQARLDDLASLGGALHELAHEASHDAKIFHSVPSDQLDDYFEQLCSAKLHIGHVPKSMLGALAELAANRLEDLKRQAQVELETRLARICPARRSRSFRIIRFRDAGAEPVDRPDVWKGRRARSKRGVQLTVWDVEQLNELGLELGKRYCTKSPSAGDGRHQPLPPLL